MARPRDKFARTQLELAEAIGINRNNLAKSWSHREGWPAKTKKGWNVRLCLEFIRKEKEAARKKREAGPHADLKEQKLEAEIKTILAKLDIILGNSISMEEHLQELNVHAGIVKSVFKQFMEAIKTKEFSVDLIKIADKLESTAMARLRDRIEAEGEG